MPITVEALLNSVGLERLLDLFRDNAIDDQVLQQLTDTDLKEIGVSQLGYRKKILGAIAQLPNHDAPQVASSDQRAERCYLTVAFVDLVGSTQIAAQLDPEDMRGLIREFHATVARMVQRFDGHVALLLGDGAFVYFGWPIGHEDSAERAVRASLAIGDALAQLPPSAAGPLRARIGIATGLVVVGGHDRLQTGHNTAIGDAPNLAARLQSLARPGSVVIAEATRTLLGDMFIFNEMPPQSVKGIDQPVKVFEVAGERPLESRFAARHAGMATEVVGRDHEMAHLLQHWREACSGSCRAVVLRGEAGIGKSRIVEALAEATAGESRRVLRYQCTPYHGDFALYPAIAQISRAAGLHGSDNDADKIHKVGSYLGSQAVSNSAAVPYLAQLLGLNLPGYALAAEEAPQQRRAQILQSLIAHYGGLFGEDPALWIVEDIHWSDPTTIELLKLALSRLGRSKLLILATTRPQSGEGTSALDGFATVDLGRLDFAATRRIVFNFAAEGSIPARLMEDIYQKTDGVPLFVEEITKSIVEWRRRNTAAASQPADEAAPIAIPGTLQDTLMARLGRSAAHKDLAQTAAVIGRQFDFRELCLLIDWPRSKMRELLEDFEQLGLVFRQGTPPDATYAFKHALVRDAAYSSLLKEDRVKLHQKLLGILEQGGGASPSVKALHADAAGLTAKALDYWEQSALQALGRPAYREAIVSLGNCVRLCGSPPDDAMRRRAHRYHLLIAQARLASEGYSAQSTLTAFERALAIADHIGDAELQLPALFGIWAGQHIAGRPAGSIADRILSIAREHKLEGPTLVGLRIVGLERFYNGQFAECHELVMASYDGYDTSRHRQLVQVFSQDPRAAAGNYLAWVLWFLGRPAEADAIMEENLQWARELNHPHTKSLTLCYTGAAANILMRRPDRVRAAAAEGVALAEGASHTFWHAWGLVHLGWAKNQLGEDDGLALMEAGLVEAQAAGARRLEPFHLGLAAEAYSGAGQHDMAMGHIARAFEVMQSTQDMAFRSELHRIRARTNDAAGNGQPVEADLQAALDIARMQGAVALELRAATALAAFLAGRSAATAAAADLRSVVARFGGINSADLTDARAILTQYDS